MRLLPTRRCVSGAGQLEPDTDGEAKRTTARGLGEARQKGVVRGCKRAKGVRWRRAGRPTAGDRLTGRELAEWRTKAQRVAAPRVGAKVRTPKGLLGDVRRAAERRLQGTRQQMGPGGEKALEGECSWLCRWGQEERVEGDWRAWSKPWKWLRKAHHVPH